ncbi:MAG: ABC transporter permease [Candidatus Riflebacteria bacterium]|nr:ABC transporter permease [Candidatus Riflebacteria bacterium]
MSEKVTIIEPERPFFHFDFSDFWKYRELIWLMGWRDTQLRIKQTVVGFLWIILQPLLPALIFFFIFGVFANIQKANQEYFLKLFSGMAIWGLFSNIVIRNTGCLTGNSTLITKIYFPKLTIPFSNVFPALFDFLVSLLLTIFLVFFFKIGISIKLVALPLFILEAIFMALAFGLLFATLNSFFRDFQNAISFIIQLWMYASPVIYDFSMISKKWHFLLYCNPVCSFIEGFRWSLSLNSFFSKRIFIVSLFFSGIMFFSSLLIFNYYERHFAEKL